LIIKRLTERGKFIKVEKWEEVAKINEKILNEIKDPKKVTPNLPAPFNDDTLLDSL
jgi:hypothetical protein